MKKPLTGPNAMSRIRLFFIATCIIALTPPLFGNIILDSRLSDAEVFPVPPNQPPESQTGFLPANLSISLVHYGGIGGDFFSVRSTSNSSILIDAMEGLQVVAEGTASAAGRYWSAHASAKLIVLSFTVTEVAYPYSMTGQLNGALCSPYACGKATAKLTSETGTIFEKVGTTLSESGTLSPGHYTLSVDVYASIAQTTSVSSDANFTFSLDGPVSVTRATNLSTRLLVGAGNDVCIGGFIVTGSGPRRLLLRGIGPSLSGVLANALPDPTLQLLGPTGLQILTNNNWRDTQEAEIIATGRAPSNDLESAIVADLIPGAYTAILAGNAGTTGVGLVEIYDLSMNQDSRLINISTRANVGTGDDIVIAGCILAGGGVGTTILRGLGPSLSGMGISGLPDPALELRDSQGALISSNDDWMDAPNQAAIIQAAGLAPSDPRESAIAAILPPGPYTALLSGANNETGMGLVEVYDNPSIGPIPTPTPRPTPTPTPGPTPTPSSTPAPTASPCPLCTCNENFDGVTAPALPTGWVASNPDPGDGVRFVTSTVTPDSSPNDVFIPDQDRISDKVLDRQITITSASPVLSFRNDFNTEFSNGMYWDGGVVEVSSPNISGGDFFDITDSRVGGTITSGGYTGTISGEFSNPLAGRMAWGGNSHGYINTVINMGPNLSGQTVTLRFRFGTDETVAAPGWRIDSLHVDGASCP